MLYLRYESLIVYSVNVLQCENNYLDYLLKPAVFCGLGFFKKVIVMGMTLNGLVSMVFLNHIMVFTLFYFQICFVSALMNIREIHMEIESSLAYCFDFGVV